MSSDNIGQKITFAIAIDPGLSVRPFVVKSRTGDTVRKIAARYRHPQLVPQILALNTDVRIKNGHYLRSATQVLKQGTLLRVPGVAKPGDSFDVHCDDPRPIIKSGYAKYDTVDRPGRVGLNRFLGYDPVEMDIAIQFEGYGHIDGPHDPGGTIEANIALLERMAGRGHYNGAANGPPAVLSVSCTDNRGNQVWLIPSNFQWSPNNQTAPLYRISGIAWGGGDQSDAQGQRVRAKGIVTVKQYTPLTQIARSATQRNQAKGK